MDTLVIFEHVRHFGPFWPFLEILVILDIWSPGHDGYIICWSVWTLLVTSETLDNYALVKSSLTFLLACMSRMFINSLGLITRIMLEFKWFDLK